jgi:ElaB/YqjD/DUF883 family membrane-anchored ribosome-binding protein
MTNNTWNDQITTEPHTLGEKISDSAEQVKDKAAELGKSAVNKIDESREGAASGLQKAATAIHEKAEKLPGGEKVTSLAHSTADKLTATADYVRSHDVNRMMQDVGTLVKNNPGPCLLSAVAIGFLVGRAFSSRD